MKMTDVRALDDRSLAGALTNLAGREREATVALILHLAEFDARQLYRGAGFPSLFQSPVPGRISNDGYHPSPLRPTEDGRPVDGG